MRKSLATKLSLTLYLALLPLALVGIFVGFSIKTSMEKNTRELVQARRVKELAGLSWGFLLTQEAVTKSILIAPENMNKVSRKIQAHDDNLAILKTMKALSRSRELLALVEQIMQLDEKELISVDTAILETLGAGKIERAKEIYFLKYEPIRARYEGLVRKLGDIAEATANEAAKKISESNQKSFLNTTVSLFASIMLVGLVIFVLTKRIMRRLDRTVQALREIAEGDGDLSRRLEVNSQDEIGKVAHWFNTFVGKIQNTVGAIAQNAEALATSSDELTAVSQRMASNAEETSAQANRVSAAADQVSGNVQTVATGADEMSASIEEIAKNASEAADVARNAVQVASNTNNIVSRLGERSAEIGQVIKVINSIAEQTNLLALNATIEAARAGEAGRGFAVGAQGGKAPGTPNARATREIAGQIAAVQTSSTGAVEAIRRISERMQEINRFATAVAGSV